MNRLKELRQNRNLTLKQLATQLNSKYNSSYSDGQLSNYENEKREPRSAAFWEMIGDFFNVPPFYAAGLIGITEQQALDIMDDIQNTEISEYQNELYKQLYDIPLKVKVTNEIIKDSDLASLFTHSARPFFKKKMDEKLKSIQDNKNYLPKSDRHAAQFAHDKLWTVIKEVDNYFMDDGEKLPNGHSFVEDRQLNPNLSTERYQTIRVAFEDLSNFLQELN